MGMFYETHGHKPEDIEQDPNFHEPMLKSAGADGEFEFDNGSIPEFVDAQPPSNKSSKMATAMESFTSIFYEGDNCAGGNCSGSGSEKPEKKEKKPPSTEKQVKESAELGFEII